jgi:hypothetical protein
MKALTDARRAATLLEDDNVAFFENELEIHYLEMLMSEEKQFGSFLSDFWVVLGGFVNVHGFGVSISAVEMSNL